jgi:hypothetical protein
MNSAILKKILPHILAIAGFALLSLLFCSPALKGKVVEQHDMIQGDAMAKEAVDYYKNTGDVPMWQNNMFSGMPSFVTYTGPSAHKVGYIHRVLTLFLPMPAAMLFIAMAGMYLLLMVLGMRPLVGATGAVAYGFSSYNLIIIVVGHITKMFAMAYMAPLLAGVILAYKGRYIVGGIVTAVAMSMLVVNNHVQVAYYAMIMVLFLIIAALIHYLKNKQQTNFLKASAVLAIAAIIGVLPGAELLMVQKDYAQYTMRGSQSELTLTDTAENAAQKQNNKDGLDIKYAFNWSYGKMETFTFLIPRFKGGSSNERLTGSTPLTKKLVDIGVDEDQAKDISKNTPLYFGPQPNTSGPVYLGAIICFLTVLALFIVKSWHKWWLVPVTLLAIIMSWGNNFMGVNEFLFNNLPFYNKFRAPTIILVIPQLTFAVLACLALNEIVEQKNYKAPELLKKLQWSFIITGGLVVLLGLLSGLFTEFALDKDSAIFKQMFRGSNITDDVNKELVTSLRNTRASQLRLDSLRSLLFILVAAGVLWAYLKKKLTMMPTLVIICLVVLIDLFSVGKRYLNDDKFVEKEEVEASYTQTTADKELAKDNAYYRTLNLASDPFNDALTSYQNKSIGGYSPAKLWIYQDLIEHQISPNIQYLYNAFQQPGVNAGTIDSALAGTPVLNMLNMKYLVVNPAGAPVKNSHAAGNAWFVSSIKWVPDADTEMKSLSNFNPAAEAIIDKRFEKQVTITPYRDSASSIKLTKYGLNDLGYESNNAKEGFGVFSEIWYPGGWRAFIDGKETPLVRVNYALRGMVIPAGKHKIEMQFRPPVFFKARKISAMSSYLLILLMVGGIGYVVWKNRKEWGLGSE